MLIFSVVEGNILTDVLFEEISELDKRCIVSLLKSIKLRYVFKDIVPEKMGTVCLKSPTGHY